LLHDISAWKYHFMRGYAEFVLEEDFPGGGGV